MIIIHNVSGSINCIIFWVFGILGFGTFWFATSLQYALFYILPLWIMTGIPYSIGMGRTIVLNANGCTIYFLGYTKTYSWEQLKYKRVQTFKFFHDDGTSHSVKMVTLSMRPLKKRAVVQPTAATLLFRPFSHIYFYFESPYGVPTGRIGYQRLYEVKESLFWEKMNEWGVEFEEDKTS